MDQYVPGQVGTVSNMSPVVMVLLLLATILILALPRKFVIVPVLLAVLLIPQGSVIVLAGVHLMAIRIIALVGCIRVLVPKMGIPSAAFAGGWMLIDTLFTCWALARSCAVIVSTMMQAPGTIQSALVNEAGHLWSLFGLYFILRSLIQDDEDVKRAIKVLAVVAAVNAIGMIYEHFRVQNLFALVLGGVQAIPSIRTGSVRSQGAFQHAILGGVYGGTLIGLLLWLWYSSKSKLIVVIGLVSAMIMVFTSASSTPLTAVGGTALAICFWPLRNRMRLIRWGFALILISLHMVMKAPVWFLIARVDIISSSTGYFRAFLIDQLVRHFPEWWLAGNIHYSWWGEELWDLSNQFVAEGFVGGLLTLSLFIAMIVHCYSRIGIARKMVEGDRRKEWTMWLLGAALSAHMMAFFGVSYWDQMWVAWATLLVIIVTATMKEVAEHAKESVPEYVPLRAGKRAPALEQSFQKRSRI
jgi:hypothetical protein